VVKNRQGEFLRRRWAVEVAFLSPFKRTFGEYYVSKTPYSIAKELLAKALMYNTIINL